MLRCKNSQFFYHLTSQKNWQQRVRHGVALACRLSRARNYPKLGWHFSVDMNPELKKFLKSWLITTFAMLVTSLLLGQHMHSRTRTDLVIAALLLGILNAFIRPLLFLIALPLLIGTLGLFMVVINGFLLYLVHAFMGMRFQIDGFGWAMLASICIGLISFPLNLMTGNSTSQVGVQRKKPAERPPDDDDGPVIEV